MLRFEEKRLFVQLWDKKNSNIANAGSQLYMLTALHFSLKPDSPTALK